MPNEYTSKVEFVVKDGPKLTLNDTAVKVESYDRNDVEVDGEETRRINIQPNGEHSKLRFLIIQRAPDDPKAEEKLMPGDLEYWVNGKMEEPIPLDNYHALLGSDVGLLLGKEEPTFLTFHNKHKKVTASVTILVGRDSLTQDELDKIKADAEAAKKEGTGQSSQQGKTATYSSESEYS